MCIFLQLVPALGLTCLSVNTWRRVWDHYLVTSLNNWNLVMNKSETWMPWLCGHGWWHHVTEWVAGMGGGPDFPLITVQNQRAIAWGGWEVFSVPVCLHQHQRGIFIPWIRASSSSSSPHLLSLCSWEGVGCCRSNRALVWDEDLRGVGVQDMVQGVFGFSGPLQGHWKSRPILCHRGSNVCSWGHCPGWSLWPWPGLI